MTTKCNHTNPGRTRAEVLAVQASVRGCCERPAPGVRLPGAGRGHLPDVRGRRYGRQRLYLASSKGVANV